MAGAEALGSAAHSSALLAKATDAAQSSIDALRAAEISSPSTFGLLGRVILAVLRVIPGLLFWIITFTTITLPTWLFTLFSTTLTFTMNFTTL